MRLRQGLVRGGIAQKAPPRKKKGQTSKRPRREIRYLRPPGSLRHRPTWHLIELSRPIVALHFPPVGTSHIGGKVMQRTDSCERKLLPPIHWEGMYLLPPLPL